MKRWKKVTITIVSIFFVIGISGWGIFKFYIEPQYIKPAIQAAEELFASEDELAELLNAVSEELAKQEQDKNSSTNKETNHSETEKDSGKNQEEVKKTASSPADKDKKEATKKDNNQVDNKEIEKNKDTALTVNGKDINELQKKIDMKDRVEGVKLATKVDVGYLLNLSKGGITSEDKTKAKEHLKEKLTEEEYNRVRELVYKYNALLK